RARPARRACADLAAGLNGLRVPEATGADIEAPVSGSSDPCSVVAGEGYGKAYFRCELRIEMLWSPERRLAEWLRRRRPVPAGANLRGRCGALACRWLSRTCPAGRTVPRH